MQMKIRSCVFLAGIAFVALALPADAALIVMTKTYVTEGVNAGQIDGPKCLQATGWPPPGNGQCNMLPTSSVGGGALIETHRVSVDMTQYPGATYLTPSSTFFPPTFATASLEYRADQTCAGCDNTVIGAYSTANFNYSSEELLSSAGALAGSYRITMVAGQGSFVGNAQENRTYKPNKTGILKIFVKAASGGAGLQGATVQIYSSNQAVGGLQYIAGSGGLVQTSIPGATWRVVITGTSAGGAITNYQGIIQVTNSKTSSYTFAVTWNGSGTPSVTPAPTNPDPTDPDEPPASGTGGTYDGPPNDMSWWQEMLYDAFVPQSHTLEQWAELWDDLTDWGPWGYLKTWWGLWHGGHPAEPTANLVYTGHIGGSYNPQTGSMIGGVPISIDFRAPGTDVQTGAPIGSPAGTVRATVRQVMGWLVWFLTTWGIFKWLRPRLNV